MDLDPNQQQFHSQIQGHQQPPGGVGAFSPDQPPSGVQIPLSTAGSSASPPAPPGTVIKRRSPIACRRCRRMRSKCVHDKARPPCQACEQAGIGAEACIFPVRGHPDNDREYRHPRMRADKDQKRDSAKLRRDILDAPVLPSPVLPKNVKGVDPWDYLPPLPDTIEAVNRFTRQYFQLGFIAKQIFMERLRTDHRSISVFLLLSILSISSRFTPVLVERYGSGMKAAETFMERASAVALGELYQEPNLERCQAFYLLSIAQQGSRDQNKSYLNMGIAMRLAALMRLHKEETYKVPNATKEQIIASESARRTLWMLHSQDNLHSGPESPVSLAAGDITALLPCSEAEFAAGKEPVSRAALEDTPPAIANPALVCDRERSLFATLVQTHYFWGRVSRRAVKYDRSSQPWDDQSEYHELAKKLYEWEANLPHEHMWSPVLMKGYKAADQDLAYLSITNSIRLCNMVLRKAYLSEMINLDQSDANMRMFWSNMSIELFKNVRLLYEQIETQFMERAPDDTMGAQMALFCVFSCGHMATYLCKYPDICPDISLRHDRPPMLQRAMQILAEAGQVWPLASRWLEILEKFARDNKGVLAGVEGSMAEGRDPAPEALRPAVPSSPDSVRNGQEGKQTIKSDETQQHQQQHQLHQQHQQQQQQQQQQHRNGESFNQQVMHQGSTSAPTPMMFADPTMRIQGQHQSQVQIQAQQAQAMAAMPQQPQQQQQQLGGRQTTDGLGLLLEAFDSHQGAAGMAGGDQPYDPNVVVNSGGYYGPAGAAIAGNDGYENELQFYIDGVGANVTAWIPGGPGGPNMYGY